MNDALLPFFQVITTGAHNGALPVVPQIVQQTVQQTYLEPTQAAGAFLLRKHISGPLVMLNLLRFREHADYSANPQLACTTSISGREAFERYVTHTLPLLKKSGGDLLLLGSAGSWLIGPSDESWDMVMLVKQSSLASFMAFASDPNYLAGLGHRTAALLDSRLLPVEGC